MQLKPGANIFLDTAFDKNTELPPTGDSSGLSLGNYDPTEGNTLVLVGVY